MEACKQYFNTKYVRLPDLLIDLEMARTDGRDVYKRQGQLEVADMGGLDIWCTVGDNLLSVMDNSRKANPILRKKVEEGKLGMKNGEGFFKYPAEEVQEKKNAFNKKLIIQLKASKNYVK